MLNYPNILAVTILCRLFVTGAVKQLALNGNLCFQLVAASLPRVVQGSVMASTSKSNSAAVRARLSHPVIDSDGHHVEYGPRIRDYIKDLAGPKIADRVGPAFDGTIASTRWYRESPEQRRESSLGTIAESNPWRPSKLSLARRGRPGVQDQAFAVLGLSN